MIRYLLARLRDRRRAGELTRARFRRGWIDSPCDGCEAALESPSYVLDARGGILLVCPSCCRDFRAAGARVLQVLA